MTNATNPLPSRRAQREAREAAERLAAHTGYPETEQSVSPVFPASAVDELPSRRSLRQRVTAAAAAQDPTNDTDQWIMSSAGVGQNSAAVATLHIEQFPTGEIAGPIDHTGEIILTGPISVPGIAVETPAPVAITAGLDVEAPGIPRRATEALSIIGRGTAIDESKRIPSVGQGISAGFATFLGMLVLLLIGLAYYTDLI